MLVIFIKEKNLRSQRLCHHGTKRTEWITATENRKEILEKPFVGVILEIVIRCASR
jgi:hypothetical protein